MRFACVPVRREGGRLVLAFGGLDDLGRVDEAEFHLQRPIEAVVAPASRVAELLKRHRGGEILLEQASEALKLQLLADDESEIDLGLKALPSDSPAVNAGNNSLACTPIRQLDIKAKKSEAVRSAAASKVFSSSRTL